VRALFLVSVRGSIPFALYQLFNSSVPTLRGHPRPLWVPDTTLGRRTISWKSKLMGHLSFSPVPRAPFFPHSCLSGVYVFILAPNELATPVPVCGYQSPLNVRTRSPAPRPASQPLFSSSPPRTRTFFPHGNPPLWFLRMPT